MSKLVGSETRKKSSDFHGGIRFQYGVWREIYDNANKIFDFKYTAFETN